jgi:signal transduction histidine kinase
MREGRPPEPRSILPSELARGTALNDLVRLSGKLISRDHSPARTRGVVETLTLEEEGVSFLATFESLQGGRLDFLNVGDVVEVAGLADLVSGKPSVALRLRTPSDARTIWVAPNVARERLVRIVGLSIALLVAAGGWIAFLRFKLAERDRAATAMGAVRDALERRVRERTRELEAAKEELAQRLDHERELNELKSRFVSMVSHEFRTPLGIIMSSAEILDAYLDRLPPAERKANLQDIFQSTRHMASMMEQVLLLGRVEAGRMKFQPAALCLRTLCLKLADEVTSATGGRAPIRLDVPEDLPPGHGDEALLRHILTNLLSNAIKYSPVGSPVDLVVVANSPDATIRVSDRGIGITETDRPLLFQAFHRGRNVGDVPGTGLGMVIVKHCVDLHGGSIRFEPRDGGGTTFELVLPLLNPKTP